MEWLLRKRGIDVNQPNSDGATPLFTAAQNGKARLVKLLLGQKDINVNKVTKKGDTPLAIALEKGHGTVATLLEKRLTELPPDNETANCIICLDRVPDAVLVPCGHQNLCLACANQWNREGKGCPVDRSRIDKILPLDNGMRKA